MDFKDKQSLLELSMFNVLGTDKIRSSANLLLRSDWIDILHLSSHQK